MGGRILVFSLPIALLALAPEPGRAEPAETCRPPLSVGFQIVDVPGGPKTAIWYPTSAKESSYSYSKGITGSVAVDGEPAKCGRFPLILFSHGLGGCGTQSVFLTEQLVRAGYVVAAPDHHDATCHVDGTGTLKLQASAESFLSPERWTPATYADRRADLESVIEWINGSRKFRDITDTSRIGMVGHSVGGYVALGMAGAWPQWRDPRIKAVLLFSPYALPFMRDNRLDNVRVPVMYQGAQLDIGITPFVRGKKGAFGAGRNQRYYVELPGGTHFEWTNAICLGESTVEECLKRKPNARLIDLYGGAFFQAVLKGDDSGLKKLRGRGLAAYQRSHEK